MRSLVAQALPLLPLVAACLTVLISRPGLTGRDLLINRVNLAACLLTAAAAAYLLVASFAAEAPLVAGWVVLDRAGAVFLMVAAAVGLMSGFASAGRVATERPGWVLRRLPHLPYWAGFQLFLAALLALPLANSLILAWLLLESTTAVSALLVAFSGRRRALEAGWKYLVLTTFGLAICLFGTVILYGALAGTGAGEGLATLNWQSISAGAHAMPQTVGTVATVMIIVGLATKVGWAPVHSWLPDAHSEAPAPISAMLSAALLPCVALIAWRLVEAQAGSVSGESARDLILLFGVISLAVAIPFLWRAMPWKRLLAYSSLEHMGVIGLAIGIASPLAAAGLILHVSGHALAKSLGFYAAIPLLGRHPDAGREPLRGLPGASPSLAAAVGVSLAALAALPPSPLFVSEVLIVAGGIAAGKTVWALVAAILLGLGFLGLGQALIEALAGSGGHTPWRAVRSERRLAVLTACSAGGLVVLTAVGIGLPVETLSRDLMAGVRP